MSFLSRFSRVALSRSVKPLAPMGRMQAVMPTMQFMPSRMFGGRHPDTPKNIGGAPGAFGEGEEQATGDEFRESLMEAHGKRVHDRTPLMGPFGTMDNPVKVPSNQLSRIVGCVGGDGDAEHELAWSEVFAGRRHICPECGQVFMLDNPNWEAQWKAQQEGHGHH